MSFNSQRNCRKQLASLLLALGLVLTARARRAASQVSSSRSGAVAFAPRASSSAVLLGVLALVGFAIQACSSHDAQRASSFRDQSVEITSLPDAAEFYLADAQQSPLAVTTKAASVQSRTALHPFGQVRFQTGTQNDPWGFVGNEEDRGSGISDFHARPYRPELGVFLAVDPVALLSPEKTIGSPNRMFAYAYASSDPITQADANGLTFGEFVHGMWDQGVESLKVTASAAAASVRANAALAMSGDIEGAAGNIVVGAAHGMVQTVKDVGNFGNDFARAVYAGSDYEAGRLAVKPVMTAMTVAAGVMGARMAVEKAGASRAAAAGATDKEALFHSTAKSAVEPISKSGFRTDLPTVSAAGRNSRFGRGVYLADSPAAALAERPGGVVLKAEADLGNNLNIVDRGPIGDSQMAQSIGRASRKHGFDSITTQSVQPGGGTNTVVFDPSRVKAAGVEP